MKRLAFPRYAVVIAACAAVLSAALIVPASAKPAKTPPAAAKSAASKPKAAKPAATKPAAKAEAAKPAKVAKAKPPEKSWEEQKKEDGVWARRTSWMSFGAGYAKRSGDLAGDGMGGYGIGYRRMMSRKWAFDAGVSHDVLGHLGNHFDLVVPFTAGVSRHFKWKTPLRPYVGLGGGYYYRKMYRTLPDYNSAPVSGYFLALGANSALDDRNVIGFETRMSQLDGRHGVVNSVFGPNDKTETLWTMKLTWSLAY